MKKVALSVGIFICLIGTAFAAINKPTNLNISYQGLTGSILFAQLNWKDNSTNEYGFQLVTRKSTKGTWVTAENLGQNSTYTYIRLPAYGTGACRNNYYKIRSYTFKSGTGGTGTGIEYSGYSNQINVINNSGALCN